MAVYVGIDNGLAGGIVLLNDKCEIIEKWIMPVVKGEKTEFNIVEINRIFETIRYNYENVIVGLEKAHVRPVQGIRAAFTTGYCLGMFQGILTSKGLGYEVINPSVWMKKVFEGNNTEDKKASVMFCQRKWPNENWHGTERSTKIHDGMTDATCIAYFLYLKNKGVSNEI
jgi:hypothetical protein